MGRKLRNYVKIKLNKLNAEGWLFKMTSVLMWSFVIKLRFTPYSFNLFENGLISMMLNSAYDVL